MKVLILGGNGMMGPWVIKALEGRHDLLVTDVSDAPRRFAHPYRKLSATDAIGVGRAAEGMDAIVNLSVVRWDRALAFNVSTTGCYNMMVAAEKNGVRRVINTGPHYQLAGPLYTEWDFKLNPDMPPQPGSRLYPLSKALGQEICRIFAERHDVYVLTLLFCSLKDSDELRGPEGPPEYGQDLFPYVTAWPDTGTAVQAALEMELTGLPSRCETLFIGADIPHGQFDFSKAHRVLGWSPRYHAEALWNWPVPDRR